MYMYHKGYSLQKDEVEGLRSITKIALCCLHFLKLKLKLKLKLIQKLNIYIQVVANQQTGLECPTFNPLLFDKSSG